MGAKRPIYQKGDIMKHFLFVCVLIMALPASAEYHSRYALVVGINQYGKTQFRNLNNAVADAEKMARFLSSWGYEIYQLYDVDATLNNINKVANELARKVKHGDAVIIYFACHGYTETVNGEESGFLVLHGSKNRDEMLSMSHLRNYGIEMKDARHILYVLDSCFSGTVLRFSPINIMREPDPLYISRMYQRRARQFIAAGAAKELVSDGLFTSVFIDLISTGKADSNEDGYITATELFSHLTPEATSIYSTPTYGTTEKDEGGDFIFFSPTGGHPRPKAGRAIRYARGESIVDIFFATDLTRKFRLIADAALEKKNYYSANRYYGLALSADPSNRYAFQKRQDVQDISAVELLRKGSVFGYIGRLRQLDEAMANARQNRNIKQVLDSINRAQNLMVKVDQNIASIPKHERQQFGKTMANLKQNMAGASRWIRNLRTRERAQKNMWHKGIEAYKHGKYFRAAFYFENILEIYEKSTVDIAEKRSDFVGKRQLLSLLADCYNKISDEEFTKLKEQGSIRESPQ